MWKKLFVAVGILGGLLVALLASAGPSSIDTSKDFTFQEMFRRANGRLIERAVVVATAGSGAKDNVSTGTATDGGVSLAYTFNGGEYVCLQSDSTTQTGTAGAYWYEVNPSASFTDGGLKSERVEAYALRCFFLQRADTKISVDAVNGTVAVKMFEGQPQ